ncbi:hypothetical protein fHeYen902_177 [Yersinia phage fHe-Yen9-02]|nr:hypothetical protein fHeYen902_177 [Yersinia phage fHe-Yen9-02]
MTMQNTGDVDLDRLMQYDGIEDALSSYCTDPTPERKLRLLNIISSEVCEMIGLDVDIIQPESEDDDQHEDEWCSQCGGMIGDDCDCQHDGCEDEEDGEEEQCEHCMSPHRLCDCAQEEDE